MQRLLIFSCFGLVSLSALLCHAASAAQAPKILMTYWANNKPQYTGYPIPGSFSRAGIQRNQALREQLNAVNVLAYAFLQVEDRGQVYFSNPAVDLSQYDVRHFCRREPASCPNADAAFAGSFLAFSRLNNKHHSLKRIISIGGSGSEKSFNNAIRYPDVFIRSAIQVIRAYHLNGIDLDFELYALFDQHQANGYTQLVVKLRRELGNRAFISVEMPGDYETLHSMDCSADNVCHDNLRMIARNAYVSLMGYEFHNPAYPPYITGNSSNLYTDPHAPSSPGFYRISDDQAVGNLIVSGVPARKIILGFPAYFHIYGDVHGHSDGFGLYQPSDPKQTPVLEFGPGTGTYRSINQFLASGFTRHYFIVNDKISAVFAYDPVKHQWISYEDQVSVAAKAHYVVANHLAGMMMWEIGEDMPISSKQSLLRTVNMILSKRKYDSLHDGDARTTH